MFFLNESFPNKRFQTDQVINCTPIAPKATLEVSNKTVTFQKPYQAIIYHTFQCFTKATSKSNWTVIRWISIILSRLRNGNYCGLFPTRWKLTTNPNLIKRLEKEILKTGWKLFKKFIMYLIWTDMRQGMLTLSGAPSTTSQIGY